MRSNEKLLSVLEEILPLEPTKDSPESDNRSQETSVEDFTTLFQMLGQAISDSDITWLQADEIIAKVTK